MIPLRDHDLRRGSLPYVTLTLICINVLVAFFHQIVVSDLNEFATVYRYGVVPAALTVLSIPIICYVICISSMY